MELARTAGLCGWMAGLCGWMAGLCGWMARPRGWMAERREAGQWVYLAAGACALAAAQWMSLLLLARTAEPAVVGLYGLALAWLTPAFALCGLQLRSLLATENESEDKLQAYQWIRIAGMAVAAVLVACIAFLANGQAGLPVLVALAAVPRFAELVSDFSYGRRIRRGAFRDVGVSQSLRAGSGFLALAAVWLLSGQLPLALLAGGVAAVAVTWRNDLDAHWFAPIAGCLRAWRERRMAAVLATGGSPRPAVTPAMLKQILAVAVPLAVISFLNSSIVAVPRLLLGGNALLADLAVLACLMSVLALPGLVASAYAAGLSPRLADGYQQDGLAGMNPLVRAALLRVLLVAAPAGLLLVVAGGEGMRLLFGEVYYVGRFTLCGAAVFSTSWALAAVYGTAATAARRILPQALAFSAALFACGTAGWMFGPRMGLDGAVWSLGCGGVVLLGVYRFEFQRSLRDRGGVGKGYFRQTLQEPCADPGPSGFPRGQVAGRVSDDFTMLASPIDQAGRSRGNESIAVGSPAPQPRRTAAMIAAGANRKGGAVDATVNEVHEHSPVLAREWDGVPVEGWNERRRAEGVSPQAGEAENTGATRQLRVLHVTSALNPGGVETWLLRLARHEKGARLATAVLELSESEGLLAPQFRDQGVEVARVTAGGSGLAFCLRLRKQMVESGPWDVVHSHVFRRSALVQMVAAWCGVRLRVTHSHSAGGGVQSSGIRLGRRFAAKPRYWAQEAGARLVAMAIRVFSHQLVACSSAAAHALFRVGSGSNVNVTVMPSGLDVEQFRHDASGLRTGRSGVTRVGAHTTSGRADETAPHSRVLRQREGIPDHATVVGHVGRFVSEKNHSYLLRVAVAARQVSPSLHFLLVGDGPLRLEMQRLAEALGVREYVHFAGNRMDIPMLLTHCMDCFFFPSSREGLGVALLEAQLAGLPCLLSNAIPPEADVFPSTNRRFALEDAPERTAATLVGLARLNERAKPVAPRIGGQAGFLPARYQIGHNAEILRTLYHSRETPGVPFTEGIPV